MAFERGPKGKKCTAVMQTHSGRTRRISFGASGYEQYRDNTGLGLLSHKDHDDSKRRKAYFARHSGGVSEKRAALEREIALSGGLYNAKILSHQYLW